jgi:lipid-binding SYLF domain-containing protein
MKGSYRSIFLFLVMAVILSFLLVAACASKRTETAAGAPGTSAGEDLRTRQFVEKANMTLGVFMSTPEFQVFRDLLRDARGVLIVPQLLKGAFVWGASGGSGVFFAHDRQVNRWNGPAFYTIGGASFGLQIGGEAAQVILLAMTGRGVDSLLASSVKLGGNIGVAVGPVGAGVDASTANLSADILMFSIAKGLYGGISLDGAIIAVRNEWNEVYYNRPGVSPSDILVRRAVTNPQAAPLAQNLSKAAKR